MNTARSTSSAGANSLRSLVHTTWSCAPTRTDTLIFFAFFLHSCILLKFTVKYKQLQDYKSIVTMDTSCCVIHEEGKPICICPYEDSLSVLGKKWAVLILRIINSSNSASYNKIFSQISGITPKAFGDKLGILGSNGLVKKKLVSSRPLRTEYSLTLEGKKLLSTLEPFFETKKS